MWDISNICNCSPYIVYDINIGRVWVEKGIKYPIRQNTSRKVTYELFCEVIRCLQLKTESTVEISERLDVSNSTVSNINTGKYKKYCYPDGIEFPIRNHKIVSNNRIISERDMLLLILDYLENELSYYELSLKYSISKSYVNGIVGGLNTYTNHNLKKMKRPLKENKKENIKIIKELLIKYK